MGKHRTGISQRWHELLPFVVRDIAFYDRLRWPVPILLIRSDWQVHMWLPSTGNDIAGTLSHDRRCLVVVNLVQKAFTWIDVAPGVAL